MRLLTCGFEEGTGNVVTTCWHSGSNATIGSTAGFMRTGGFYGAANTQNFQRNLVTTKTTGKLFARGYWRCSNTALATDLINYVGDGAALIVRVLGRTDNRMQLNVSGQSNIFTTATFAINTYYRVEVSIVISASAGEAEVRFFLGDSLTDYTAALKVGNLDISTIPAGNTGVSNVRWGQSAGGNASIWDDLALNDEVDDGTGQNSWCGPGHVLMIKPTTIIDPHWDSGNTGAVGAGDTNATNINELPATLTDSATTGYNISKDAAGTFDRFDCTNLVTGSAITEIPSGATISLIHIYARVGSEASAPTSNMRLKLWDHNGIERLGPSFAVAGSTMRILANDQGFVYDCRGLSIMDVNNFTYGYEAIDNFTNNKKVGAYWVNVEWTEGGAPPAGQPAARRFARETLGLAAGSVRRM